MYFIMTFLEKIVKATVNTRDDKALEVLKKFLLQNKNIRENLISVLITGWNNGFDHKDEKWTSEILELFFDILKTKYKDEVHTAE